MSRIGNMLVKLDSYDQAVRPSFEHRVQAAEAYACT
ncbi:hypothetical protein J4U00_gp124 [Mycobacterium phage DyoEdafos]|uniref:Uncharacterized protein n=1 Tax=Mycobacterium phage DyoEdafos TaxID=2599860 RepID=A0A5J6TK38_9CAUD|nr:hypothetical protein J4U00_gp124 [Mycobacterium phage DyoEdafos]QFG10374.1 hypothetical protein SEA_DYOEDAFOS_145 [Mycobacterium phage DyoEdafos]